MDSEPLTHEQKIAQAKVIGWEVTSHWVDGWGKYYDLWMPEGLDHYGGLSGDGWTYESAKTEDEAWARLPDDPTEYWIQRIALRREHYKALAKEVLEDTIAEANADYQRELAEIEEEYQDALAVIKQAGERK